MNAVLHVPQFGLQAVLRHEPEAWDQPVVLVDPAAGTPRVLEATAAARRAGVVPGASPAEALARCREVRMRHRSARAEALATEVLLQVAYGFTPHLEATAPGWVTMDLRGLSEFRSGEAAPQGAWGARVLEALDHLHLRARLGLGPTPHLARLAARWGGTAGTGDTVAEPAPGVWRIQDAGRFVACLPVEALEPSSGVGDLLRRWGLQTVGDVLALGQAELAERLGLEALALFAAASVTALRPLNFVQPAERFEEQQVFDPPVDSLEPLLFVLRRFVDSLGRRLEACGLAAGILHLGLVLETGAGVERTLRLPQPNRHPEVLFRMLQTHLETLTTDAPVGEVRLRVEPSRPEQKQFDLFQAVLRDPHLFQETLARLVALVGPERVGSPRRTETHRSDAFTLVPPDFERAPAPGGPIVPDLLRRVPLRRLRPPLPAEVEPGPAPVSRGATGPGFDPPAIADARGPQVLQCRQAHGRVQARLGPWESSGQWWESEAWSCTEWDVSLPDGQVLRLNQERGAWRVVAILD